MILEEDWEDLTVFGQEYITKQRERIEELEAEVKGLVRILQSRDE